MVAQNFIAVALWSCLMSRSIVLCSAYCMLSTTTAFSCDVRFVLFVLMRCDSPRLVFI